MVRRRSCSMGNRPAPCLPCSVDDDRGMKGRRSAAPSSCWAVGRHVAQRRHDRQGLEGHQGIAWQLFIGIQRDSVRLRTFAHLQGIGGDRGLGECRGRGEKQEGCGDCELGDESLRAGCVKWSGCWRGILWCCSGRARRSGRRWGCSCGWVRSKSPPINSSSEA